jgi:hypothetical protein
MKIDGFQDGDRAWGAVVFVKDGGGRDPARATTFVQEVTIVLADGGVVREDGRPPRISGFGETFHKTRQAAIAWSVAEIRRSADALYRQAEELAEPRVVTV